jgi:hypothetical protein
MISWFFLFVFPSSFLMAFIMVGGNGWRNRTVQLSIAHTSKQASNTSNSAARSKPMFQTLGYICKLDIYLLSRERGGITFSHPSNGTGHIFLLLGASHFNHNSTTNDPKDTSLPRYNTMQTYRHERFSRKHDEWNGTIRIALGYLFVDGTEAIVNDHEDPN